MNGFWRAFGGLLVLIGLVAIGVVAYLIGTGRVPGNFLTGLLLSTPALLVIFIGSSVSRAAKRRAQISTTFDAADAQWTRRRIRQQ